MANDRWNYNDVLCHHGVKGQKWGTRRYQYEDGTWTAAGKARRRNGESSYDRAVRKASSEKASRGTFRRALKKLSKSHDRSSYELIKQQNEAIKAQNKLNKTQKKVDRKGDKASNRLLRKLEKRTAKLEKEKREVSSVKEDLKKNRAATKAVISKALKKGYSIESKEFTKNANEGKRRAAMWLAEGYGAAYAQAKYGNDLVRSTSYKVKKVKDGQKAKHYKQIAPNDNTSMRKYAGDFIARRTSQAASNYLKENHSEALDNVSRTIANAILEASKRRRR